MRRNTVKTKHYRSATGGDSWHLTVHPDFYKDWEDGKTLYYMAGPYSTVGKFEEYFVDTNHGNHMFADKEAVINSGKFIERKEGVYESIEEVYLGHKMELRTKERCSHIHSYYLPKSDTYRLNVSIPVGGRS